MFGVRLIMEPFYQMFSVGDTVLMQNANNYIAQIQFKGLFGQFALGFVLGLVWSPCVGPTLGAAISLAAQGKSMFFAFLTMLIFSVGTVTPLLFLARLSRPAVQKWKENMANSSRYIQPIMAATFVVVGLLFVTGYVFKIEEAILNALPTSFIQFITQF